MNRDNRDSFIFYKSFYDSIKELKPTEQSKLYNAIFKYQFEGELVELNGICKSIFKLILPQLEANNRRYKNGCKGGRPRRNENQSETEIKPNENQSETEIKPNENDNVNDNVNENVLLNNDNKDIYTYIEKAFCRTLTPIEIDKIDSWLSLYNKDIIKYAVDQSVYALKKTIRYVEGILNNLSGQGLNSLNDIKETETKRQKLRQRRLPKPPAEDYDWLNEDEK